MKCCCCLMEFGVLGFDLMSAVINPNSCLRRYLSFIANRRTPTPFTGLTSLKTSQFLNNYTLFPPCHLRTGISISTSKRKHFSSCCSVGVGASAAETISDKQPNGLELGGDKVREFRKRLRIIDGKGGPDEGLDRLGHNIVVKGWVRTLRQQSSVTFLEVNDGLCLSNMQCVINSDAQGYDQVESGLISTGASVCVKGTVVVSQGSKQKVELSVAKVITVGTSDSSFPIQKKRVSREFLRTKSHLRPRTNTFDAAN